jgi:peptide/nickel transport system permease protein
MVGQDTTPEQRAQLRGELGLDDPFVVQFARFVSNAAQGDFGISYRQRRPVSELLEERMPATLELSFVSAVMALALGIPMGIYTALKRHGVLS